MGEKGIYRTFLKKDPHYKSYLLGTFSNQTVALPVESFGVGSDRERTTFLMLESAQFKKPFWLRAYWRAIRPELLGLTLGHAVLAVLVLKSLMAKHNFSTDEFWSTSWVAVGLCLLATFFTHASACLFNDYQDHMNGTDRRSVRHGSRVIQKGWSRAVEIRWWGFLNASLAFAIGFFLLWQNWLVFLGLATVTAMAILLYSGMTPFWNRLGAGDFWITLLFGPLIFFSVGTSILSYEDQMNLTWELLGDGFLISFSFGLLASWTLQVRQFQDIFRREGGSFRTLVSRLSFDQAQTFLKWEGLCFFVMSALVFYFVWREGLSFLFLILVASGGFVFFKSIDKIASPLSSKMLALTPKALALHGGLLLMWLGVLCLMPL